MVDSSSPNGVFGTRNIAFPFEHVGTPIFVDSRFGHKTMRVVLPPFSPLLLQSIDDELVEFFVVFH